MDIPVDEDTLFSPSEVENMMGNIALAFMRRSSTKDAVNIKLLPEVNNDPRYDMAQSLVLQLIQLVHKWPPSVIIEQLWAKLDALTYRDYREYREKNGLGLRGS